MRERENYAENFSGGNSFLHKYVKGVGPYLTMPFWRHDALGGLSRALGLLPRTVVMSWELASHSIGGVSIMLGNGSACMHALTLSSCCCSALLVELMFVGVIAVLVIVNRIGTHRLDSGSGWWTGVCLPIQLSDDSFDEALVAVS